MKTASKFILNGVLIVVFIYCMAFCLNAIGSPLNITGTWFKTEKVKTNKRLINVHESAFDSCNEWCRGSCGYIQIDPNQNNLYRYVCKKVR